MRTPRSLRAATATLGVVASVLTACAEEPTPSTQLGPRDGADLPAVEPERVAVGDTAPDFSLRSHAGEVVTLSDYRGKRDVLLVFYRGHW